MLFVAGVPGRYLVRLGCAVGLLAALFLADVLLRRRAGIKSSCKIISGDGCWFISVRSMLRLPVRRRRRSIGCGKQHFDDSHNVRQALISVGSGGLTGKGWRQGTQNALGYLPRAVAHNDFIFSVIAGRKDSSAA